MAEPTATPPPGQESPPPRYPSSEWEQGAAYGELRGRMTNVENEIATIKTNMREGFQEIKDEIKPLSEFMKNLGKHEEERKEKEDARDQRTAQLSTYVIAGLMVIVYGFINKQLDFLQKSMTSSVWGLFQIVVTIAIVIAIVILTSIFKTKKNG